MTASSQSSACVEHYPRKVAREQTEAKTKPVTYIEAKQNWPHQQAQGNKNFKRYSYLNEINKKAPSDEGAIDTNLDWRSAEGWEGGSSTEVTRIGTCDRKGVGDCCCLSGTEAHEGDSSRTT